MHTAPSPTHHQGLTLGHGLRPQNSAQLCTGAAALRWHGGGVALSPSPGSFRPIMSAESTMRLITFTSLSEVGTLPGTHWVRKERGWEGVRLGLSVLMSLDLAAQHPCDERGGAEEENFRKPKHSVPLPDGHTPRTSLVSAVVWTEESTCQKKGQQPGWVQSHRRFCPSKLGLTSRMRGLSQALGLLLVGTLPRDTRPTLWDLGFAAASPGIPATLQGGSLSTAINLFLGDSFRDARGPALPWHRPAAPSRLSLRSDQNLPFVLSRSFH